MPQNIELPLCLISGCFLSMGIKIFGYFHKQEWTPRIMHYDMSHLSILPLLSQGSLNMESRHWKTKVKANAFVVLQVML